MVKLFMTDRFYSAHLLLVSFLYKIDYDSMIVAEMRNFSRENGLRGYTKHRSRGDLINFLQNNYQPMSTAFKTTNFVLVQCSISGQVTKLRATGQVQACLGMSK